MCCCVITYLCHHRDKKYKPYHCQCDNYAVADKSFHRPCEACQEIEKQIDERDYQKLVAKNDEYFARHLTPTVEIRMNAQPPRPRNDTVASGNQGNADVEDT